MTAKLEIEYNRGEIKGRNISRFDLPGGLQRKTQWDEFPVLRKETRLPGDFTILETVIASAQGALLAVSDLAGKNIEPIKCVIQLPQSQTPDQVDDVDVTITAGAYTAIAKINLTNVVVNEKGEKFDLRGFPTSILVRNITGQEEDISRDTTDFVTNQKLTALGRKFIRYFNQAIPRSRIEHFQTEAQTPTGRRCFVDMPPNVIQARREQASQERQAALGKSVSSTLDGTPHSIEEANRMLDHTFNILRSYVNESQADNHEGPKIEVRFPVARTKGKDGFTITDNPSPLFIPIEWLRTPNEESMTEEIGRLHRERMARVSNP